MSEPGWKLIHGDVFRSPGKRMLLSVLSGNGIQLLITSTITLCKVDSEMIFA